MIRRIWAATGLVVTIAISPLSVWAGNLTPPGAPAPTMHTLTEIYDSIDALQQQMNLIRQQLDILKRQQGASGFSETVGGMVLVPAGSFLMGDHFSEYEPWELPVHTVYVSAFYMDQYPVTMELWNSVRSWAMGEGYSDLSSGTWQGNSFPVFGISWFDCVKWANARSQRDGLTPVYYTTASFTTVYKTGSSIPHANWAANGYRLPTEAEWERAARGGVEGRRFPWADVNTIQHARASYYAEAFGYDTSPTTGQHPNFNQGAFPTSMVGAFLPNGYGLYDMAGNVLEWCWDWFSTTYYSSSPDNNPRGPTSGSDRVTRGGLGAETAVMSRVAFRGRNFPSFEKPIFRKSSSSSASKYRLVIS